MRTLPLRMTMRTVILLLQLLAFTNASPLSTLFKAIAPACPASCLEFIVDIAEEIISDTITEERLRTLCRKYEEVLKCSVENCSNSESDVKWMETALSGLKYACVEEGRYMGKHLRCIEAYYARINKSDGCEARCELLKSMQAFSESSRVEELFRRQSEILAFVPSLYTVCKSLPCYVECFRKEMNSNCKTGGSRLAEVILRPFELLSVHLRENYGLDHYLTEDHISSCSALFNRPPCLRVQQELYSDRDEVDVKVEEKRRPPQTVFKKEPLKKELTASDIGVIVFMAFVLIFFLAALVFVLVRCAIDNARLRKATRELQEALEHQQARFCIGCGSSQGTRVTVDDEERPSPSTGSEQVPESPLQMTEGDDESPSKRLEGSSPLDRR